ncbi:MAG: flagellar protein FlaG [Syntrophomonadaceae bacterium]|nr:flagellar protein FlaG [Syntrophomonadaceae bacterium]
MEVTALKITPDMVKSSSEPIYGPESTDKKISVFPDTEVPDGGDDTSVSAEEISQAVEAINKTLEPHNTRLEFSIHDKTKGIMVKVINEKTGEIIREVPPKRVLDMVAMTWDELGLIVDEKA